MTELRSGEAESPFIDTVDEAVRTMTPRTPARRRRRQRIEDIATRQLRDAQKMARLQRKDIATGYRDPEFVRSFNETTKTITSLLETIRRSKEGEIKAFAGLNEYQLDRVLVSQLSRIAPIMSADEKRLLLEIWFGNAITNVLLKERAPGETTASKTEVAP